MIEPRCGQKAKLQDKLVQLWSRMLCQKVPESWAFISCELNDDGLGECHIGSFRRPPESVSALDWCVHEQAWTGGSLALWREDGVLHVTFEHGHFGVRAQLPTKDWRILQLRVCRSGCR